MTRLLEIAIGPVQSFIAAGRKTRDLWYGSDMLVQLALLAAEQLGRDDRKKQIELIFPHPDAVEAKELIPNRLLARVDGDLDLQALAKEIERTLRETILQDWKEMYESRTPYVQRGIDEVLAKEQIEDFLEVYAAWYPIENERYPDAYRDLGRLLAGRKALRNFKPAHGRSVPKSSLDPSLESVIVPRTNTSIRSALSLKGKEELDGVSLLKRRGELRRFVSTARIAIDPFIVRLEKEKHDGLSELNKLAGEVESMAKALKIESPAEAFAKGPESAQETPETHAHLGHLADFRFDTQLFYDPGKGDIQRLIRDLKSDDPLQEKLDELQALETKMRAFFDRADSLKKEVGVGQLPVYYAMLRADGDRMGEAISHIDDYLLHQKFSKNLSKFATDARNIVSEHRGVMIYSGGDDVLAMVPLHRVLACADCLRKRFNAIEVPDSDTELSLSTGIVIGHYSAHLNRMLAWAADAEHAAKEFNHGQKNALAVSLHTRSGGEESLMSVSSWDSDPVTTRFNHWIDSHRKDALPDGAAFEFRELLATVSQLPAASQDQWTERKFTHAKIEDFEPDQWSLFELEVNRILHRKRPQRGREKMTAESIGTILTHMNNSIEGLDNVVNEMLICRRIAQAMDIASGMNEKRETPDD